MLADGRYLTQTCCKRLLRIAETWWGGSQQRLSLPSRAAVFLSFSVCGVSSQSFTASEHHQRVPSPAPPEQPHWPAAQSPPKHKSSSKVQGTLQLAPRRPTPWASAGTGQSLHPQTWLLLLWWVPDGLGLGGRLRSLPDFTGAVVQSSDPRPRHRA